ncbi:uncharacterized protein TrAtP1_001626 [Trichoderma atroviride]|uniref:uncharacterized protein n=1 Tax=Hypocrea atroviridis TaxID=63577 RepID=UPI003327B273|nr:hypothetical protein TrAtP1_001626 [Trichoderma atroviride]
MSAQSRSASSSSGCTGDQWKSLFIGSRVCAPCSALDVELRLLCSRINGTELVRTPVTATLQLCNSDSTTIHLERAISWPGAASCLAKVGGNRPVHAMLWVRFSRRNETSSAGNLWSLLCESVSLQVDIVMTQHHRSAAKSLHNT